MAEYMMDNKNSSFKPEPKPGADFVPEQGIEAELHYGPGLHCVSRLDDQRNQATAFPPKEETIHVEDLSGSLDFSQDTLDAAVALAKIKTQLPDEDFSAQLDSLIDKNNLTDFRHECNVEIARGGGKVGLIRDVKAAMRDLRPNDQLSKQCLELIRDMVIDGRMYGELPESFELPPEQQKFTER